MPERPRMMPASEFREAGYLQEVNRRLLHPLGLALEVVVEEDGTTRLGGVWDYRDDPEGLIFADGLIDAEKAAEVSRQLALRGSARLEALGYVVQPAE